ncbi:two-component SAPR family response regulator [Clostridium acetobutylicum]|nr:MULTISPECIES: response regulator [Clostridium]ADZ22792.1 Response regulator (CheY + HTH domains) [Clostridium acetobutylicum EA 2018]NOV90874.1 two-component SAPR family response regulator [Clostridium acetobutylicum]NOW16436.1 two-component SAPR family response regulator [Clostridium acetobutylicum]NRY58705.1 two-component SAPR family response regulator [Clostridium acetobutylicum]NSA94903.1 two-component SAPR family response regulator [Clostridium acetobutylicum]
MISAIIVDNEVLSANNLYNILKENSEFNIKARVNSEEEALLELEKIKVDIIFINIEMQVVEFVAKAREINDKVKIIFITAYTKYSSDSNMQYLIKPVTKEKLNKVILKLKPNNESKSEESWDIKVSCFGKFTVQNRQGTIAKWITKKAEELFALLIDQKGKAINTNKIIYMLWRNFDTTKATVNLHTTVYNIKKALSRLNAQEVFICSDGFYKVDVSKIKCDVWEVISKIRTISRRNLTIDEVGESIKIIEDGYFKENYFDWAEDKNKYFESVYLKLIFIKAKECKKSRNFNEAIELIRIGLKVDELNESFNKELIRLLMLVGDEIEAIKHYNFYKRKLRKELGINVDCKIYEWIKS